MKKDIKIIVDGSEINLSQESASEKNVTVVSGDLMSDISSSSGIVIVLGDIKGDVISSGNNVSIIGNISGSVRAESGDISIVGNCDIAKANSGNITIVKTPSTLETGIDTISNCVNKLLK